MAGFLRTTYVDEWGREYHAIKLSWDQVHEILGCDHEGNGEDDGNLILIQALREMGAPEWIDEAEGWIDEHGWGLIGPEYARKGGDNMNSKKRETIYLPADVAEAFHRASLAAGGYGEKTRIAEEAISAHPEVRAQLKQIREERDLVRADA